MDEKRLEEIEARAAKATAGPWQADNLAPGWALQQADTAADSPGWLADFGMGNRENTEFCAAARTDVPDLCREVRRLREACEAALAEMERVHPQPSWVEADCPGCMVKAQLRAALAKACGDLAPCPACEGHADDCRTCEGTGRTTAEARRDWERLLDAAERE